jgi:hypothetical protein
VGRKGEEEDLVFVGRGMGWWLERRWAGNWLGPPEKKGSDRGDGPWRERAQERG